MSPRPIASVRTAHADDGGQTIVLVALLFVLLMGFAALSLDVGRFYSERRYLQNAVDSAALACARAYAQGGTAEGAWDAADNILQLFNLKGNPIGAAITYPGAGDQVSGYTATLAYQDNIVTDQNLIGGIKPIATPAIGCRVAITANVDTYFIKLIQPSLTRIGMVTKAYATSVGGQLPIVVNRYYAPPGPSSSFLDYTKQEAYQVANPGVCAADDVGGCPDAAFSPVTCTSSCLWGPETVIVGGGYSSSDSDFRGFIALDVRRFSQLQDGNPVHVYYNGTDGMGSNALKSQESNYVTSGGYPGPDLVAYDPSANPIQADLQIATMSGNSSGIVVDDFNRFFNIGDQILAQVFDGQVRTVPDFTLDQIASIAATSPSGPANGPTFRVGANQSFRSDNNVVDVTMIRDQFNGGSNDTPGQLHDVTFNPDDFVPSGGAGTTVRIENLQLDAGLASGIYSVIVSGTGYEPPHPGLGTELATHREFVPLNVGGVTRDFQANFAATSVEATGGANAVFTATLTTGSGGSQWNGGAVSVAADYGTACSSPDAVLSTVGGTTCRTPTITSSPSFVPAKNSPPTVTISVPTTGLTGSYSFVVRFRGTNGASPTSQPVVHVYELTINTTTSGGSKNYINIQGYAVFEITRKDSNTIFGRAVSKHADDPNDPTLAIARKIRLVPWETP